ncbi:hypothetical protein EGW08_014364, partial [Elysia chlorotica]
IVVPLLERLWPFARFYFLVVVFTYYLLFIPLSSYFQYQKQGRCAYVIIIMAVFWTTEVLPLAVTSLLPVVLLPALGVMTARDVSAQYFNDTSMLFVGGLVVAIAVEEWDVHRRIALLVLKLVGAEPKRCCVYTGVPLSKMCFVRLNRTAHVNVYRFFSASPLPFSLWSMKRIPLFLSLPRSDVEQTPEPDSGECDESLVRLKKAISLAVAYSANIGGIGSLTGTGPNLVFFAAANQLFRQYGLTSPVSFATWLVFGLPLSLVAVVLMWAWLIFFYLRCRFAQGSVLTCFVVLVIAWITRNLGGGGGWGDWFPLGFVSDSTPSTLAAILLFVLPSTLPAIFTRGFHNNRPAGYSSIKPLLTWKPVHEKMPWNIYLLLGGGFAIAVASERSGLSAWVGQRLLVLQDLNNWAILVIICYITVFATEVTSNTAIATLLMPILSQMAISLRVNPLFFMFPATISSSFAFMLPVATPPNAIVFSYGDIKVIDMVKTGFFLNAACVPLLLFATATWGNAFFDLETNPAAFLGNITSGSTTVAPSVTVS